LDVATGSADIPIQIIRWARKMGLEVSILAIYKNPQIIKIARKEAADYPEITLEASDFYETAYPKNSFEYCVSSLFLHHLNPKDVLSFLRRMYELCHRAVFVNDLIRGWVPYYAYRCLACLFRLHPMTCHDGAVSVLRAFTIPELNKMVRPEFDSYEIKKHFPYRFGLTIRKDKAYE
jgi:ubiquinone/menaquinone biosynthesis C-methylase UbiE